MTRHCLVAYIKTKQCQNHSRLNMDDKFQIWQCRAYLRGKPLILNLSNTLQMVGVKKHHETSKWVGAEGGGEGGRGRKLREKMEGIKRAELTWFWEAPASTETWPWLLHSPSHSSLSWGHERSMRLTCLDLCNVLLELPQAHNGPKVMFYDFSRIPSLTALFPTVIVISAHRR